MMFLRVTRHQERIKEVVEILSQYNYFPENINNVQQKIKYLADDSRRYYVSDNKPTRILVISVNENDKTITINSVFNITENEMEKIVDYLAKGYNIEIDKNFISNTLSYDNVIMIVKRVYTNGANTTIDQLISSLM